MSRPHERPPAGGDGAPDARDRVLEHALHTLLTAPEAHDAQVRAIAAAFREAAATPAAADLDAVEPAAAGPGPAGPARDGTRRNGSAPAPRAVRERRASPARPAAPARWRRVLAPLSVAAAAAAVALVLWWRSDAAGPAPPAPGPEPVARAARPVAIERAGRAQRGAEVLPGDAVRTDAEPAELSLAGARVELAPWSRLAFPAGTDAAAELELGELRVAADRALALRLGGTLAALAPDTVLRASLLPPDASPPAAAGVHPADAWRATGATRRLRYAVAAGSVELRGDGWTRPLGPDDVGTLLDGAAPPDPAWGPAERKQLLADLEAVWPYEPGWNPQGLEPFQAFCAELDRRPGAWDVVLAAAREEIEDPAVPEMLKRAWIHALCMGASPGADEVARALWLDAPELFEPWHVVWLGERGAFEMRREMHALVDGRGELDQAALLPAVALALRGDAGAIAALHGVEERPADAIEDLDAGWLAAWALAAAGEPGGWERRLRRLEADVHEALELRAVGRAARLVLNAEFFLAELDASAPGRPDGEPGAIALLRIRHAQHLFARGAAVRSSGEVLAALEALPR